MEWKAERAELAEMIAYMVLSAPNDFPVEDFLPAGEQMTLERGFTDMRERLERMAASVGQEDIIAECRSCLVDSLQAYQDNRVKEGAWKLQEMERLLWRL